MAENLKGRQTLRAGFLALALRLQEAASELSANDIRARLSDSINDAHRGTGSWAYYVDHFGDSESGDVIYSVSGDTKRCGYEISGGDGTAAKCVLDLENATDVVPRTVYEEELDEQTHYAQMEEALKTEKLYTELPLYERFIGKVERDKADASDFAGKGRSFPILKPDDVMAAVRSMGRAGTGNLGPSGIKARIITIAKRKGWEKYLPKSWQSSDKTTEGARQTASDGRLMLLEAATSMEPLLIREAARSDYEIKLIAPGRGAMAIYPAEVLKRDGAAAFPAETKVYLNHPTQTQESDSPGNRDVHRLAGVLTKAAEWKESHPKGPGLYSRVKVFQDHAALVEEKAPYLAMSIAAGGTQAVESASGKKLFQEGLPILASLTAANAAKNLNSVDIVPIAGAGGLILTEAARTAANPNEGADDMDAAELKKLQESMAATAATNLRLMERAVRGDAREEAVRILKGVTLIEAAKERVIEAVTRDYASIPVKDGELDVVKFTETVQAAAKAEGSYVASIVGSGRVLHMGAPAPPAVAVDPKEAERKVADDKRLFESAVRGFMIFGLTKEQAEAAASLEGVA